MKMVIGTLMMVLLRFKTGEELKQIRWGKASARYYRLETNYFISSVGSNLLTIMARNHLWIRMLAATPLLEAEVYTLKRVVWYFEEGGMVLLSGWYGTFKWVVWYYEERGMVL